MLANGDAAYPQMIAAIEGAAASVALSSYIFRADAIGDEFITALVGAHRRGVEIRVLIDGYGGGYLRSATYHKLHHERVPVARFMHSVLPWRMPFLNLRTHRKILCVDGRVAFTGGLNIGAENVVARKPRHMVLDSHFASRSGRGAAVRGIRSPVVFHHRRGARRRGMVPAARARR